MREIVDVMDENILLTLREGSQGLKSLSALADINYNTLRQRMGKLSRYGYISKPGYGEYALTGKGRQFIEELTLPVAPDLKDPKLKKLIDMLPTELHRAFFRLLLSGIIAKYHLSDIYDDGYPAFILGGETKSFKTALAKVICRLLGLKPDKIYPLFSAIAGEFGIRRFRTKGNDHYSIAASPLFKQPFICLDEFDKVTDRDTRRNILFYLDGRHNFTVEGETVENHVCTMITLNTKIGKEDVKRFGIPEPYIRRSIVADTEHVRMELRDVDLVAKKIFEMKDFPKIDLSKLRLVHTELTNDVFNCLRDLLMNCTNEVFQGLTDTRPLVILALGRSALLDGDVREAMYQTIWDRLVCLESLDGTVAGWREKVAKEWAKHEREEQPEIEKQLREAEQREKERKLALEERKGEIQQRTADQIGAKYDLLYQRQCLVKDIRAYIPRFQYNHPELAKPLEALWREVAAKAVTNEALKTYRLTFTNFLNQKVFPVLAEEKKRLDTEARKQEQLSKINPVVEKVNALNKRYKGFGITNIKLENWLAEIRKYQRKVEAGQKLTLEDYTLPLMISIGMPQVEATLEGIKQRKEQEERQRHADIANLRFRLKEIGRYLQRKRFNAEAKEDPFLILQELGIISPSDSYQRPAKGDWVSNGPYGKFQYKPPIRDFMDMVGRRHGYSAIKGWVNWQAIYPLLQMAQEQLQAEVKRTKSKT